MSERQAVTIKTEGQAPLIVTSGLSAPTVESARAAGEAGRRPMCPSTEVIDLTCDDDEEEDEEGGATPVIDWDEGDATVPVDIKQEVVAKEPTPGLNEPGVEVSAAGLNEPAEVSAVVKLPPQLNEPAETGTVPQLKETEDNTDVGTKPPPQLKEPENVAASLDDELAVDYEGEYEGLEEGEVAEEALEEKPAVPDPANAPATLGDEEEEDSFSEEETVSDNPRFQSRGAKKRMAESGEAPRAKMTLEGWAERKAAVLARNHAAEPAPPSLIRSPRMAKVAAYVNTLPDPPKVETGFMPKDQSRYRDSTTYELDYGLRGRVMTISQYADQKAALLRDKSLEYFAPLTVESGQTVEQYLAEMRRWLAVRPLVTSYNEAKNKWVAGARLSRQERLTATANAERSGKADERRGYDAAAAQGTSLAIPGPGAMVLRLPDVHRTVGQVQGRPSLGWTPAPKSSRLPGTPAISPRTGDRGYGVCPFPQPRTQPGTVPALTSQRPPEVWTGGLLGESGYSPTAPSPRDTSPGEPAVLSTSQRLARMEATLAVQREEFLQFRPWQEETTQRWEQLQRFANNLDAGLAEVRRQLRRESADQVQVLSDSHEDLCVSVMALKEELKRLKAALEIEAKKRKGAQLRLAALEKAHSASADQHKKLGEGEA
jgi:hypothetical protein